jgi:hypothetical protein
MSHVTILSAIQVHQFFVMFQGIMNNPVVWSFAVVVTAVILNLLETQQRLLLQESS